MKKKAFVLLSGGIDSTTCLAVANEEFNGNVEGVSIDYGQRHSKEIERAADICDHYGFVHHLIDLRGVVGNVGTMLTDPTIPIPSVSYSEITGVSPTYVPFRNGTMLAALASYAQQYVNEQIALQTDEHIQAGYSEATSKVISSDMAKDLVALYVGVHAEDAHNWAYPDCTPEFVGAMANAIYVGTYFTIRLKAPFVSASKSDIVSKGSDLNVPYALTWSCYAGGDLHCGVCPTCRARKEAFNDASITDPTSYADQQVKYSPESDEIPF